MAEGQVYDIPEGGLDWLKERVAKLSRKIEKLGGEKLYMTVVGFHFEGDEQKLSGRTRKRKIWEVFLAVPEIKLAGWEFMARLDHTDEGTILRKLTAEELPVEYRGCSPACEHCGYKRRRRDTFVVRHTETMEWKQVGSTCLRDFTGHEDAAKLAKIAEIVSNMPEVVRYAAQYHDGLRDRTFVDVQQFCEIVANEIMNSGWVSKARAKEENISSTADRARTYWEWGHDCSEQAKELARAALEWASNLEGELSDYEHNIKVIASTECMEERSLGIAASIVGVYWMRNQPKHTSASHHQGRVGDTIERTVTIRQVQALQHSTRFQFIDDSGNIYTWFASNNRLKHRGQEPIRIRATVKDHTVFRDVQQTLITRVTALD